MRTEQRMRSVCGSGIVTLCWVAVMAGGATAQDKGNIYGVVRDPSGAVIPGVAVTATNEGTGFLRSDITKDDGTYLLQLLPVGSYRIEGEITGFKKGVVRGVGLTVGSNVRADLA